MSLQNWLQIGHLTNHQATVAEVRSLLGVVDRELSDAGVSGLSDDGRFAHAYDGALILCKLALHVSGFELHKRGPGNSARTCLTGCIPSTPACFRMDTNGGLCPSRTYP